MITEIVKTTFNGKISTIGKAYDANGNLIDAPGYVCGIIPLTREQYEAADGFDALKNDAFLQQIEILDATLPETAPAGWCLLGDTSGNILAKSQEPEDKILIVPEDYEHVVFPEDGGKYVLKVSAKSDSEIYVDIVLTYSQRRTLPLDEIRSIVKMGLDSQGNQMDISGKVPDVLLSILDAIEGIPAKTSRDFNNDYNEDFDGVVEEDQYVKQ